ncbi:MAG: hypothetical protein KIT84_16540 [Labilithrix sp.]|nr:hypothetical protein [Labilithrix sp.]MCW5812639.1 hypothetical protein [Labilithrix sp.]
MVVRGRSVIVSPLGRTFMNEHPPRSTRRARTSIDILHERDALAARVEELSAVVAAVAAEVQHALRHPETSLTTVCRIETVVSRAPTPRSTPD